MRRGREPAGPAAARRGPAGGKGRAGWARRRGRGGEAAGGEAGGRGALRGGEPSAAVGGRAPLELFCQPPYLWAEYFRGGEGGDCGEGLEMMGLGRNHPPGGREGGMPGPGRNHRRGGVCARWRLPGRGQEVFAQNRRGRARGRGPAPRAWAGPARGAEEPGGLRGPGRGAGGRRSSAVGPGPVGGAT